MSDDVTPNNLAAELGMTPEQAKQLRKDVEFGRVPPPVRAQAVEAMRCPVCDSADVIDFGDGDLCPVCSWSSSPDDFGL